MYFWRHKLISALIVIIASKLFFIIFTFQWRVEYLSELHKCPACYGVSACDYVHQINLDIYDYRTILSYLFGVKNVFFGIFGDTKVVIKKLASDIELQTFDKKLLLWNEYHILLMNYVEKEANIDFDQLIKLQVNLDYEYDHLSHLRICPTTQRLEQLLHNVYVNNKNVDQTILKINIWTLISLNPEPLILQALPADNGWPIPKYLGACGRVIIEEYVGLPLGSYYNAPWQLRVKIASSLLQAADMFTFHHKNFSFYLTDVSADNIAVDFNNVAKFIDLENIIVVDRGAIPTGNQYEFYENREHVQYPDQIIFSPQDICNHKISDHNFYVICQSLLALNATDSALPGGLLYDLSTYTLPQSHQLQYLLIQCSAPTPPNTRVSAAFELRKLLDNLVD